MAIHDASTGQRQFLLVEDFDMMRGVLRRHLMECGAQRVDTAASARDAATLLQKNAYDVVLCDYNLGPGKNGQQLLEEARHLRWIGPATVWIMITAEKSNDMVSAAAEQAPDDYLLKPITEATLQTRIHRLIERKSVLGGIGSAMKAGDLQRALRLCEEQLAAGSKNTADLLRLQAQIHEQAGEPDKARAVYEGVLKRAPLPWARLGIARLHVQAQRYSAAQTLLEELVRDHPQFLEAYDHLANLLRSQGAGLEALQVLQRAAKISPNNAPRQSVLGDVALAQGDAELATQCFKRSIKLGEHSAIELPDPYLGLARVHSETGEPAQALEVLQQMLQKCESHEAQVLAKAEEVRAHHAAGNTEALTQALQATREHAQSSGMPLKPDVAARVAETLMQAGQRDEATQMLLTLTRNNHDDDALIRRVQGVFDQAGLGDSGRELLAGARRQATEASSEGLRLLSQGQLQAAVDSLRGSVAAMPQNTRVLLNFAAVAIACMDKQGWNDALEGEARQAIETAQALRPEDPRGAELLKRLVKPA